MANVKTLLLCFIHGFRGGDWTFDGFPHHLANLIHDERPELRVETAVYPKYETRGELVSCVAGFRQWLLDKVLTMGKAAGNTSPKTTPSVGVVLIGHSMGGFVASDALLSLLTDHFTTTHPPKSSSKPSTSPSPTPPPIFPLIHGILSFDTPYLGLSRSMFAYGAVSSYQGYSSATSLFALLAMRMGPGAALFTIGSFAYKNREALQKGMGALGGMRWDDWMRWRRVAEGKSSEEGVEDGKEKEKKGTRMSWENVQEGLAYLSKENLGEGMAYITSHLEFVGVLFRGVELQERLERLGELSGVGFADLYTTLGTNSIYTGGYFIPERTFIAVPPTPTTTTTTSSSTLPSSSLSRFFIKEPNLTPSTDEISAHLNMFSPLQNTSYTSMSLHAKGLIISWVLNNRGIITDPWQERKREQEDQWEGLSRYTVDEGSGRVMEWDVAVKEREAREREAGWRRRYTPDVGRLTGYIPGMPGLRNSSRPGSRKGEEDVIGGEEDGKAFDEALARTVSQKEEGDDGKSDSTMQTRSFWSRYMPSSITTTSKSNSTSTSTAAPQPSAETSQAAFTSYLWSPDTGITPSVAR